MVDHMLYNSVVCYVILCRPWHPDQELRIRKFRHVAFKDVVFDNNNNNNKYIYIYIYIYYLINNIVLTKLWITKCYNYYYYKTPHPQTPHPWTPDRRKWLGGTACLPLRVSYGLMCFLHYLFSYKLVLFLQKSPKVSGNLQEFTGECNLGILYSSSFLNTPFDMPWMTRSASLPGHRRLQWIPCIAKRGGGYCWLKYCCLELVDRELFV